MEQQTQICLTVIVENIFQQEVMPQPAVQSLVCTSVNFLSWLILFIKLRIKRFTYGYEKSLFLDCTGPFEVGFRTDATRDANADGTDVSRGVCLEYVQLPCGSVCGNP